MLLADLASLTQRPQLVAKGAEDVGRPPPGAEHHLPAASRGDDEGRGLIVKGVAVRIRADRLGVAAVQPRLADVWVGVVARAAVFL